MESPFAQSSPNLAREGSGTMDVVRGIWPVMISLFLSGVVGIMVFPFFTYVPSSGWLNDLLPKVLCSFSGSVFLLDCILSVLC